MKQKTLFLVFILMMLSACSIPVDQAPPPTALATVTAQPVILPIQTFTPLPTLTETPLPIATPTFCSDSRIQALLSSFATAIANKDGVLLSSLISPARGMDVQYYRDGKIINYDTEHSKFIFETSFQTDWGLSFGSGQPTVGSFQEIVLPSLQQVITPTNIYTCNEIKTGGVTYEPIWPYPYMDFYSINFPGTDQYNGLDWQTWAVGFEYVSNTPYITTLVHFVWEP